MEQLRTDKILTIAWVRMTKLILPKCQPDHELLNKAYRENVRKFALETLMPDILENGLWVPLLVRPDTFEVVDGAARLIVLRKLMVAKVPVVWFSFDRNADERSPKLDELTTRVPNFAGSRPMLATLSCTSRAYCRVVSPPLSPRPANRN